MATEPPKDRTILVTVLIVYAVTMLVCIWLFRYQLVGAERGFFRLDRWTEKMVYPGENDQ